MHGAYWLGRVDMIWVCFVQEEAQKRVQPQKSLATQADEGIPAACQPWSTLSFKASFQQSFSSASIHSASVNCRWHALKACMCHINACKLGSSWGQAGVKLGSEPSTHKQPNQARNSPVTLTVYIRSHLLQPLVEHPYGQAAKLEVRAQHSGSWHQCSRVALRLFELDNPRFVCYVLLHSPQRKSFPSLNNKEGRHQHGGACTRIADADVVTVAGIQAQWRFCS